MTTIESIQIGLPRDLGDGTSEDPMDRPWRSGFFKLPVAGPVRLEAETIVGDGVADRVNHGGLDKAVLGYAAAHAAAWASEWGVEVVPGGAFGENLTINSQTEADVCVGDVYEIGGVVLEVSQPRQPCWKLGRRWRRKELPARVIETGRTGWYFRVLKTGELTAGQSLRLADRPHAALTVAALNDMFYGRRGVTTEACDCSALAIGWREHLRRKK